MGLPGNILNAAAERLNDVGRGLLSQLYPRDFELYMCALELVDENDKAVDFFTFPVMPNNITKTEIEATTIQQSFNGITIFNKSGFIPNELTLQGDFGRAFKVLPFDKSGSGDDSVYQVPPELGLSISDGYYTASDVNSNTPKKVLSFPYGITTGYGCIKMLQAIIDKSKSHGQTGKTFQLYFYNPALGENYLVVPTKSPLVFNQNVQSSNMVWQYTLNLIIIADMKDVVVERDGGKYSRKPKKLGYAFTYDKLLGGIATPSSLRMSYRNMLVSTKK